jgi:hypothetical protein
MRQVKAEHPNWDRYDQVTEWFKRVSDHVDYEDSLFPRIWRGWGDLLNDRCTTREVRDSNKDSDREESERLVRKAKAMIQVRMWDWILPTVGKPLKDCTFGDCEDAARPLGGFLAKLALQGAPGAHIKDVFTPDTLQKFAESIM